MEDVDRIYVEIDKLLERLSWMAEKSESLQDVDW